MSEKAIEKVAEEADVIVSGYAFTTTENHVIRVLNLNHPEEACVLDENGMMLETTMDDAALCLVQAYYLKNKEFLEVC